jgi:hypothetical protein
MRFRPFALLLLGAGSALGQDREEPRGRAAAPPAELLATVRFAPGGNLVGPWQGYAVELDNRAGRELDLRIRIEDDAFSGVAIRRERLSPGGRKRVFLYGPGGAYARQIPPRYRISDASERELAAGIIAVSPRGFAPNQFQVGLYSPASAGEEDYGFPSTPGGLEVRFARLSPETFPDRWVGLASLDLIVLHDAPLDELSADQARALAEYVRRGGSVLLSPGPSKGWLAHPVLASFAPLRVGPPQEASSLPGLNGLYGSFRRAEPFLIHPLLSGEPLRPPLARELVRVPSGLGRVFVICSDIRRAPFDTWAGRRSMWNDLMANTPRWYQEERVSFPAAATPRQRFELFQHMARLINPYPSFGLILSLAVLFLAAVGPLNYFLLWRLRRTLLLVVTIPAISIGFLGLVVVLGYVLKGTSTVVHSARLLSTRSGLDCAREIQLFSLFSPSTRTYDVLCEPGVFGAPPARWSFSEERYYGRQDPSVSSLTCDTSSGLALRGIGAGQWQSWDLETRALAELGKGVRFDVQGLGLRVNNDSSRSIERGIFVQTGRDPKIVPFAAIPPGGGTDAAIPSAADSDPVRALGFGPDTLGDRLLRPWLSAAVRPLRPGETNESARRFLICVLKEDRRPVQLDARVSDRSRELTLLHVAEAP